MRRSNNHATISSTSQGRGGRMEKIIETRKELKRIEMGIIERLVILLYYNRRIKKTKIAMQGNMSYDKCVLYLDWMETMDLINREIDEDGYTLISLSDKGRDLFNKKFKDTKDYLENQK